MADIPYEKILAGHYDHVKVVTHRGHSGWTRKVNIQMRKLVHIFTEKEAFCNMLDYMFLLGNRWTLKDLCNNLMTQVMYAPHLDLIISCSTTSTNSLVLGMKEKNKIQMRT